MPNSMNEYTDNVLVILSDTLTLDSINAAISEITGEDMDILNTKYSIHITDNESTLKELEEKQEKFIVIVDSVNSKRDSVSKSHFAHLIKKYSSSEYCMTTYNSYCHNFLVSLVTNYISVDSLIKDVDRSAEINKIRAKRTAQTQEDVNKGIEMLSDIPIETKPSKLDMEELLTISNNSKTSKDCSREDILDAILTMQRCINSGFDRLRELLDNLTKES